MKYSFMTFSCPELTFDEVLALAAKYGYDGVEPRAQADHAHHVETESDAGTRATIRKQAEDAGIAICCVATSCRYTSADPAELRQQIDDTRRLVDVAGDVGCSRLRVFGGPIPNGMSREDAVKQVSHSLRLVADHAAGRGVTLCVETHDDWRQAEDMVNVLRTVDHPNVQLNWDIMHPVLAGMTMDDAYAQLAPYVRHVHFHDGRLKDGGGLELMPVGQGLIDHARAVALLQQAGYDGYLSGEWINWEPYDVCLPRELATMKALEA